MRSPAAALLTILLLTLSAGGQEVDVSGFDWIPTWKPPVVLSTPQIRALPFDPQGWDDQEHEVPEVNLAANLRALLTRLGDGGKLKEAEVVSEVGSFLSGRAAVAVSALWLWDGATRPPKDAAEAAGALKSGEGELLFWSRFDTRRGEWVAKGDLTARTLIAGMEVEVAQEASIADPVTAELSLGTRVAVQCLPDTGDGATVRLSLQMAFEPAEAETVRTSTGTVDLIEVPFVSLFAGMNLRRGKPHLILLRHPSESGLIAITVSLLETRPTRKLPFLLVDLSAVAGAPEAAEGYRETGIRFLWDQNPLNAVPGPYLSARNGVLDLARANSAAVFPLSPTVTAVLGEGQGLSQASLLLSAHSEDVQRVRDRLPWEEFQRSSRFDPLTGSFDAGYQPDDSFPMRVPVLDGTATLLHSGFWRMFLAGEAVEIAQAAAIHQPITGAYFEGEAFRMTGARPTRVEQATSRLVDRERREIDVRKDVLGRRERERSHLVDILRTLDTRRSLIVGPRGATTVRREEDEAVVEVWR